MKADRDISVIRGVLEDELERNARMRMRYISELKTLPKGSILIRKLGKYEYCYLKYRENGKSVAKYLGKKSTTNISELTELIKKRKHIEDVIKRLVLEEKELGKALKIRRA